MKAKALQFGKAMSTILLVMLLFAAGMVKMFAQSFTVDNLNFTVNQDATTVTVTGHVNGTSATGSLIIPETVTYQGTSYDVTIIGDYAFRNCSGFTGNLIIPSSITEIGKNAFYYCRGFTEVHYNATNCADASYETPFTACRGSLSIGDNVVRVPARMFGESKFTGSLTLGNSVASIGYDAFYTWGEEGYNDFTMVNYSGTLSQWCSIEFGDTPLRYAHNLYINGELVTDLVIPETVMEIKPNAFRGARCLTSLTIPNSVTSIGYHAFFGCDGLTSLTIGNSMTEIGEYAFFGCSSLIFMSVLAETPPYLEPTEDEWGMGWFTVKVFDDVPKDIPVFVPTGTIDAYRAAEGWNEFTNYHDINGNCTISAISEPTEGGSIMGLGNYETGSTCTLIAIPNEGYSFCSGIENDLVASYSPTYSFLVTGDRNLMANFGNCPPRCTVIFNLFDEGGDGWNGASLNLSFSDGSPSQTLTIEEGGGIGGGGIEPGGEPWNKGVNPRESSLASYSVLISEGVHVTLSWASGYDDYECSFTVSYENGGQIFQASSPSSGILYEFDCNCTCTTEPIVQITPTSIDFGEVEMNQGGNRTLYVSGTLLQEGMNIQLIGDDASMFSYVTALGWNDYSGGELIVYFNPNVLQWEYHATLVISSGSVIQSVALSGTVPDIYVFNTYVDEDIYPMNTAIPIHGIVTDFENNPVANMEVEVGVTVLGWRRTLQAVSNENGEFSAVFEPLPMESGYYTVNSGMVGNNSTAVHDSFDILGMTVMENTLNDSLEVVNNRWLLCDVIQNIPKTGHVQIINHNSVALTNIQVTVLSAPEGCELTFTPMNLAGLSEGYLNYSALGTIPTQGNEYKEVRLKATCDQGVETLFTMWFYCEEAQGALTASPKAITTTVTRSKSKIIDVTLGNNGMGATGTINISLPPNLEWMSVVGEKTLPSIAVNGSATFSLRLSPSNETPLGLCSGTIVINCAHGTSVTLPFSITVVSGEKGALLVDVIDEYTTNTNNGNGPHVEGAEVTLTGYYSLDTMAHGYTDAAGIFSVDSILEGHYYLKCKC